MSRAHNIAALAISILVGSLAHLKPALAQSFEGVCAYQTTLYIGPPSACASMNGEVIWRSTDPAAHGPIRFIQFGLAALGYDPGPVDGADGPQTRAAIRRFNVAANINNDDVTLDFMQRLLVALQSSGHLQRLEPVTQSRNGS